MKNIVKIISACLLLLSLNSLCAQNINWQSLHDNQKDFVYLNFGYDFGITSQLGYAYKINASKPIFLSVDYSFPMGNKIMDDFKFRLGGQILLIEKNNWKGIARLHANFRRHQTSLVRMASFGSEIATQFGYFKPTWNLAVEFGFDKSITTHLKHSERMRENYQAIQDGWLIPSGGNFFFGIQGSKTIAKQLELNLSMGATSAQGDHENAVLPFYAKVGIVKKLNVKNRGE